MNPIEGSETLQLLKSTGDKMVSALDSHKKRFEELEGRLSQIEVKGNRDKMMGGPFLSKNPANTLAKTVLDDDGFQAFKRGNSNVANIDLPAQEFKALLTGTGSSASVDDSGIVHPDQDTSAIYAPRRRELTIRDLLPSVPTDSNLINYHRELAYTDRAGLQAAEGEQKPESEMTFEKVSTPVVTIAHVLHTSSQVLDDSPLLMEHLMRELAHSVRRKSEIEIISGSGDLKGFEQVGNHTSFTNYPTSGTKIDIIAAAQAQLWATENDGTAIVLNPADWQEIRSLKDKDDNYLFGYPNSDLTPRLWGMSVVLTNAIDEGGFLVIDTNRAAIVRDRQAPSVRLSRDHSDNFVKNVVTFLAEERLALTVVRPSAVIFGLFTEST